MTARSAPTGTVSSSWTRILLSVPATGDGISVSTLSVETSSSGSSTSTWSPSALSQRVTVPSVTDSPKAGMVTVVPSPEPLESPEPPDFPSDEAGAGSAAGCSEPPPEPSPMTARPAPTGTVSSSPTSISCRVPATGDGISVSTLSVETSSNGSSTSMVSPTLFSQRVTVPSVTDSPRAGMVTRSDMTCFLLFPVSGSSVCVQGLARQGQVCLAERFVLCGVRVDETGDVLGVRLPGDDELRLADLLAHAGADHVDPDDGTVDLADELDKALRAEDLRLAVAAEVVLVRRDLAVLLARLRLRQTDAGDLGVAVGDARDARLVDDRGRAARDLLGDEDALGEA